MQYLFNQQFPIARDLPTSCVCSYLFKRRFSIARNLSTSCFYCQYQVVTYTFARAALLSKTSPMNSDSTILKETCAICLENVDVLKMFSVDYCFHRFCFSCVKKNVKVQLRQGIVPKCPFEGCRSDLEIDSCTKLLTPELIEIMTQCIKEARVPFTERIYCPNSRCSTLMSKCEALEFSEMKCKNARESGARKCIKCCESFCVNCKVPWHENMSCYDYKSSHIYSCSKDAALDSLAKKEGWRQCKKCSHMIELAVGCFHMTCRCGYEFCYTCGMEWREKKPTCTCPRWDECYIIRN